MIYWLSVFVSTHYTIRMLNQMKDTHVFGVLLPSAVTPQDWLPQMQPATEWNHLTFFFFFFSLPFQNAQDLPPLVPAKRSGNGLCKVSLCAKCMWTAGLPRACELWLCLGESNRARARSHYWCFLCSFPPCNSNLLHVFSFYLTHTCGNHGGMCNTCKHKQAKRTRKGRRQRGRQCASSGCVMCVPLDGRLKRRFCFPHQRASCWRIPLSLSLFAEALPPFLSVSWINNKG